MPKLGSAQKLHSSARLELENSSSGSSLIITQLFNIFSISFAVSMMRQKPKMPFYTQHLAHLLIPLADQPSVPLDCEKSVMPSLEDLRYEFKLAGCFLHNCTHTIRKDKKMVGQNTFEVLLLDIMLR